MSTDTCRYCGRPLTTQQPRPIGYCDGGTRWYALAEEPRCKSDRYRLHESDPRHPTAHDGRPLPRWRAHP
jgi:hypothetical protein